MHTIDWLVLLTTLTSITAYGIYRSRAAKSLEGYFLSDRKLPWHLVLLSVMGTQASAITFLSAPGQSYTDGLRFVQYYFGLPLAMIILLRTLVPVYIQKQIFTPYSWLQDRFDKKTKVLTAFLFLLQRGLSTGISIYAPSIILSTILGWNIYYTNLVMGGILIIYTVYGGAMAIAYTQQIQLIIILCSMALAGYIAVHHLPAGVGLMDAIHLAKDAGKMNMITSGISNGKFNWSDKYNIISGVIGGLFLALSYFGTDHSQVGRLLTSKNFEEVKKGMLMNGVVKIPMQLGILMIGIFVFAFYQYQPHKISFNKQAMQYLSTTKDDTLLQLNQSFDATFAQTTPANIQARDSLRKGFKARLTQLNQKPIADDTNHIFIYFVINELPIGLIGLLIAVIFLAAWGSISAALNSLAACTLIDIIGTSKGKQTDAQQFKLSKQITLAWGLFCIAVAMLADNSGSLIELVNKLGSWFYGTILGIFFTGLWLTHVKANALFVAACIVQVAIITATFFPQIQIGFLWFNVIGCFGVMGLSMLFSVMQKKH
jgi:solute:Na+ symporter, SSS family